MFAQANSEHCRHKIFNAAWIIDGAAGPGLFEMIRNTRPGQPRTGILSAYKTTPRWWRAARPGASSGPGQSLSMATSRSRPTS
jgi:phosphoribosylformylglycinamidine (FGAM) synthase-like enzyme